MNVSRSRKGCAAHRRHAAGGFGNRALGQVAAERPPPLLDAKRLRLQPEEVIAPLKILWTTHRRILCLPQSIRSTPDEPPHYHDKDGGPWSSRHVVYRRRCVFKPIDGADQGRWLHVPPLVTIITMAPWTTTKSDRATHGGTELRSRPFRTRSTKRHPIGNNPKKPNRGSWTRREMTPRSAVASPATARRVMMRAVGRRLLFATVLALAIPIWASAQFGSYWSVCLPT